VTFDLSRFAIHSLAVEYERAGTSAESSVTILVDARCVSGNGHTRIKHEGECCGYPPDPREMRGLILAALEHELDECLFVDGVRLMEPHS
jgi:hypothetical protein